MQLVFTNDARMKVYDSMNRAGYHDTYSALWCVRKLTFDPGRLSEHPGRDWDGFWLLKVPLAMVSNSSFW